MYETGTKENKETEISLPPPKEDSSKNSGSNDSDESISDSEKKPAAKPSAPKPIAKLSSGSSGSSDSDNSSDDKEGGESVNNEYGPGYGHRYIKIEPFPVEEAHKKPETRCTIEADIDSLTLCSPRLDMLMINIYGPSKYNSRTGHVVVNSSLKRFNSAKSSRWHVKPSHTFHLMTSYGTRFNGTIPLSRFRNIHLGTANYLGHSFDLHQFIVSETDIHGNNYMFDRQLVVIIAGLESARLLSANFASVHRQDPFWYRRNLQTMFYNMGQFRVQKNISRQKGIQSQNGRISGGDAMLFFESYGLCLDNMCESPEKWKYRYDKLFASSFQGDTPNLTPITLQRNAIEVVQGMLFTATDAGFKSTHNFGYMHSTLGEAKIFERFMSGKVMDMNEYIYRNFMLKEEGHSTDGDFDCCIFSADYGATISPRDPDKTFVVNAKRACTYLKKVMDSTDGKFVQFHLSTLFIYLT